MLNHKIRISKLREKLEELMLDAYLCVNIENSNYPESFYFSGFTGSFSILIIDESEKLVITDSRYFEQIKKESDFALIKLNDKKIEELLVEFLKRYKKVGINFSRISHKFYKDLIDKLENVEFVDIGEMISEIRAVKYKDEIETIRKAIQITQKAFENALNYLKAGITEKQFAAKLEYEMKMLGAEKVAFPTIVASGYRGALPHGRASDKIIEDGELVVIDFGAVYNSYCGDITRTVAVGNINEKQYEVYEVVKKAQEEAVKKMRAGMSGQEIDKIARDIIDSAGYGKNFGHSLGHGVGIEVHEAPSLSPRNSKPIPSDVVVTVEPGIYLSGNFGVRIEDDVLLTKDGAVLLSKQNELIKV